MVKVREIFARFKHGIGIWKIDQYLQAFKP